MGTSAETALPGGYQPSLSVTRADAPAVPLTIHERAADAGCYTFITEKWSVDDRVDEAHVRAIREAWPNYVPLRCRRIFRSPAGTDEAFDYHVIGSYIAQPTEAYADAYLRLDSVPRNFPFPPDKIQPMRILAGEWDKGSVEENLALPPPAVAFGGWVVEQMRAMRKYFDCGIRIEGDSVSQADYHADKLRELLESGERLEAQAKERAREEMRYRTRHNWPQFLKAIENGRIAPEPPAPKPFVDLNLKG